MWEEKTIWIDLQCCTAVGGRHALRSARLSLALPTVSP